MREDTWFMIELTLTHRLKALTERKESLAYATDGVVIRIVDEEIAKVEEALADVHKERDRRERRRRTYK